MSKLGLLRRFAQVLRSDGIFHALNQSGRYLWRRFRGQGDTSMVGTGGGSSPLPDQYLSGIWQSLSREGAFHIPQSPSINRGRRQIAMIADLNLPQCRKYRVEQLAAFWRGRGVEFEYAHYQDVPRAARIMQHATHLVEYRLKTGPAADMLRYEARRLRLPILYDLDDPLFSISAYETYRNMEALAPDMKSHFVNEAPKYLSMMNGADILSVSTPGMAEHAALYSDRPIYTRRNFADVETLRSGMRAMKNAASEDGHFRIAFASGSQGHEVDLCEIIEPLAEFILADPKRKLMLIGHCDPALLPIGLSRQMEQTKFTSYPDYLSTLQRANCAVMPLCNDAFNSCKSAVRVLDAAAVGVPSIVGSVGDLQNVVQSGVTGFVSETKAGWLEALKELAQNPRYSRQLGSAARKDLENRWSGLAEPHIISPELIQWVDA